MSAHPDDQTFALFQRAALDGERYGYPDRLTVVDPAMDGAEAHAWEALSAGAAVLLTADGVEVLIEPERPSILDRWLRRVPVAVSHRPLDPPRLAAPSVRLHQTMTRRSVFEYRPLAPTA